MTAQYTINYLIKIISFHNFDKWTYVIYLFLLVPNTILPTLSPSTSCWHNSWNPPSHCLRAARGRVFFLVIFTLRVAGIFNFLIAFYNYLIIWRLFILENTQEWHLKTSAIIIFTKKSLHQSNQVKLKDQIRRYWQHCCPVYYRIIIIKENNWKNG